MPKQKRKKVKCKKIELTINFSSKLSDKYKKQLEEIKWWNKIKDEPFTI